MGRAFLAITDDATGKIISAVDIAIDHVEDFRPVWADFKRPWYSSRRHQRLTQGASTGPRWLRYDQTPERRRYRFVKGSIVAKSAGLRGLRDLGADGQDSLLRSLKPLTWPGKERLLPSLERPRHPDAIWNATPKKLETGTSVPYARNHDQGIGRAPKWAGGHRIPKRPLLRFGRCVTLALADAVGTHAARVEQEFGRTTVGFSTADVLAMQRGGR